MEHILYSINAPQNINEIWGLDLRGSTVYAISKIASQVDYCS